MWFVQETNLKSAFMNTRSTAPFVALIICGILGSTLRGTAQSPLPHKPFWHLSGKHGIRWTLSTETRLPHTDNIEMSGQKVSAIIRYEVDKNKELHVTRTVVFPQLRAFLKATDPDWMSYRAYLRKAYEDRDVLPAITIANKKLTLGPLDSVIINGKLNFYHHSRQGMRVERTLLPSMTDRFLSEKWTIVNTTDSVKTLRIGRMQVRQDEWGADGRYEVTAFADTSGDVRLNPRQAVVFGLYFTARLNDENARFDFREADKQRDAFLQTMQSHFAVESEDSLLNTLFYFSKIRVAESIFVSKMGLVHSPGGGRYYTGVWANDQAEYSGPFFPYLGYEVGIEAAMNTYRMFLRNLPPPGKKTWASFEMQGDLPCCSKDRGDAAMIAYGASHFLLASGNRQYADTLWPLLDWALRYCEQKKNAAGVIESDADELEGRFESGKANLSTSSLYYGALLQTASVAKAMGKPHRTYLAQANALAAAIEGYFGADIAGLPTYRYYENNTTLRSWICLPLVMGITNRREGTLDALFTKLWTENGVKIEAAAGAPEVFWDRGTLYAFRGAFKAGAANRALEKLQAYSATRLLGFHVPYAVEAWPEGDMAHLSSESALYARIFTEGILGLEPDGFSSFKITPRLPDFWKKYAIRNIKAYGSSFDITLRRANGGYRIQITATGRPPQTFLVKEGKMLRVTLKP